MKSRCQQDHEPSKRCGETTPPLPASGGLPIVFGVPWLAGASLESSLFICCSPCVSTVTWLCFYKDTSHIRLGTHPTPVWPHLNLPNYMCKDRISKWHIPRISGLRLQHVFSRSDIIWSIMWAPWSISCVPFLWAPLMINCLLFPTSPSPLIFLFLCCLFSLTWK